jgi:hypothetical protein
MNGKWNKRLGSMALKPRAFSPPRKMRSIRRSLLSLSDRETVAAHSSTGFFGHCPSPFEMNDKEQKRGLRGETG